VSILTQLSSLALKGAAHSAGHVAGVTAIGIGAEALVGLLQQRFTDHSSRLTRALERASGRAWRSVEIAMAGRSWWDRCTVAFASADDRAIRQQVQAFLDAHPLDGVDGHGPDFRGQCVAQLQAARKAGLFDKGEVDPAELAGRVGDLSRFGDQSGRIDAEFRTLDEIADRLRQRGYEALATFLTLRPASGPPLLLSAMRYFFQREVEKDQQLFQGLAYARLESLAEGQSTGFVGLAETLEQHGDRVEGLLTEVQAVVVATHANVLDMKSELARQGQQIQDLGKAVLDALQQHHLERRELTGSDSLSIRDENERRLVRELVYRYRALPHNERQRMPALLNAVGKLQVVAGDFESAERDFRELVEMVPNQDARAEAAHNAYRAALERRAWGEALFSFKESTTLDPARFAPFPTGKYEPERILGAGGFGVAFLCRNRHSSGRVVIKTLRRDGLDRDLNDVFREAQALEDLEHPAIIRIRDCDYADTSRSKPYLVMDYFPGQTLADYIDQYGSLEPGEFHALARLVASGLQRAHSKGILHRDIKPHNLLVRRVAENWEAKLIDFGLALRAESASSTAKSSYDKTLAGSSLAGTLEYAAPEQIGKVKGVAVGTYSDVYGFGKTCCFALFGTAQPTYQHWQQLPRELADLLGRCLSEQPRQRPQDFTVVLRELDRISTASILPVKIIRPVEKARPIRNAEPVEEVLPVIEPVRPRPALPRRRPEFEDQTQPEPARRSGVGFGWVVTSLGVFLGAGAVGMMMMFLARQPSSTGTFNGGPKTTIVPAIPIAQKPPAPEPIAARDFPKVLDELKKKPTSARLQELASRLAVTEPTAEQKKKHDELKQKESLPKEARPSELILRQLREQDDIVQVSQALNPLSMEREFKVKMAGVQAMQKWGTSENVKDLISLLEKGDEGGVFDFRVAVARALGAIGDERGIAPVAKRLEDQWDRSRGLIEALIAFGPKAENEVARYLNGKQTRTGRSDHAIIEGACQVLKEIGTEKSLPRLKTLANDSNLFFTARKQAAEAVKAIESRSTKKGS
jgi:serine/threonine protein kinase